MKILINKIINKVKEKHFRYVAITNKILPLYHDKFRTTNKTVKLIDKKESIMGISPEHQDDIIVEIYKDYEIHTSNPEFEVNGVREGDLYEFKGLGFLGNIDIIEEVFLVTNNYVFLKKAGENSISCYTHDEIGRMKSGNSLIQLNAQFAS